MELEEHDDDLTDVVPANRGVQDLRQVAHTETAAPAAGGPEQGSVESNVLQSTDEGTVEADQLEDHANAAAGETAEPTNGNDTESRDRSWRGRRRRRGGRRDGRERGHERGDKQQESRTRPAESSAARTPSGPPPRYEPILLPGESISKYQRLQRPAAEQTQATTSSVDVTAEPGSSPAAPITAAFPEDEPIFAGREGLAEPLYEQHEDLQTADEAVDSASTSSSWNREFRNTEKTAAAQRNEESSISAQERDTPRQSRQSDELSVSVPERLNQDEVPAFAAPGTLEEETIEEEEVETPHYETASDEGYDEFEEETQAAGHVDDLNGDAREAVSEIHLQAAVESGEIPAVEGSPAEAEEDSEEAELEEAQAQAEAMLDA